MTILRVLLIGLTVIFLSVESIQLAKADELSDFKCGPGTRRIAKHFVPGDLTKERPESYWLYTCDNGKTFKFNEEFPLE